MIQQTLQMIEAGKLTEAAAQVEPLFNQNPRNPDVLFLRGYLLLKQGNLGEAVRDFESCLEIAPGHPHAKEVLQVIKNSVQVDSTVLLKMGPVIEQLRAQRHKNPDKFFRCLEIGTIRSYDEKHESTRHLGELLNEKGSVLSIDIDPHSITVARDICKHLNNIEWIESDSISALKRLIEQRQKFDFILLDGANDAELNYCEYVICLDLLENGGSIVIDDCGVSVDGTIPDPRQPEAKKGHKVFEFLNSHNLSMKVAPCSDGNQLVIPYESCQQSKELL